MFRRVIFCLWIVCSVCVAEEAPHSTEICQHIEKNLPHYGVLKQSGDFVYVDVDDEYIHTLISYIREEGFQEPPYFGGTLCGAHISVIYSAETILYDVNEIEECGEKIAFIPQYCKIVHPPKWQEMDEVYFLVVEAPRLDEIRERYGLPKREYAFHITIGVKPVENIVSQTF